MFVHIGVCVCVHLLVHTKTHEFFESGDRYQKMNIISFLLFFSFIFYGTRILIVSFLHCTHFCCLICIIIQIESLIRIDISSERVCIVYVYIVHACAIEVADMGKTVPFDISTFKNY